MHRSITALLSATVVAALAAQTDEDTYELDPLVVNANRLQPSSVTAAPPADSYDFEALSSNRFGDISDALNAYPGFSAFRRTHAIAAHPTTQGVRLRNVGANATSRALVLHDGVPQNDPFGAWVYWHQFDLAQLEALSIYSGGSGELWGNFGSGGVISLVSQRSLPGSSELRLGLGSSDRVELQGNTSQAIGENASFDLGLRHFESDGFHTLRADQRGSVDQPARSEATLLNARLRWSPSEDWNTQFSFKAFDESRNNGTPLAGNDSEGLDFSLIAERALDAHARFNFTLYFQDRDFRNVFTSVAQDRNSERPALEQYDVPSESFGGAVVYRNDTPGGLAVNAGFDFRSVEGAVNERYRNLGDGFTRNRYAGGEQLFVGAFTTVSQQVTDRDRLSASVRVDRVRQSNGRRIETDTTNGQVLLNQAYADRYQSVLSGNLHWRRELSDAASLFATAFSGFRAPTLNELYRPYRVRNDITESNPELVNERQQGIEFGYSFRDEGRNRLRLSAFHYELDETIANALLTTESGFDPRFGFIPEGGSGSQRANLDKSQVSGIELHGQVGLPASLTAAASLTLADSEVRSDELTQFEGKSFPQSPPLRVNLSLDWQANRELLFWANYHWSDRSWEGLGNTTRLGAAADLTLGARYQIAPEQSLTFAVTNAFNETNVTGIASNGLVTIDAPREFRLTWSWQR